MELINEKEANEFTPDIVITLGNQIISKRIRRFLKKDKPVSHWDISPHNVARHYDVFDIGVQKENITESEALDCLLNSNPMDDSFYNSQWKGLHKKAIELTGKYLAQTEYSDIKVFETLVDSFPKGANIQYGNSTPVRYSNFFEHSNDIITNSNRGTSGIDGCVSTAAGAAYVNEKLTICIVGDISFFYDSNALFNNYLSPNFRIIVINNSGGNIFRLIDVPAKVNAFEKFFEMRHNLTAKYLAAMYDIPYYFCETEGSLNEILPDFYKPHNGKPAILEIKTNGELSAKIYKEYFSFLKNKIL